MKRLRDISKEEIARVLESMKPPSFVKLLSQSPNDVQRGKPRINLDKEEIMIYKLMGKTNVDIAHTLNVSPSTIDRRVNELREEGYL